METQNESVNPKTRLAEEKAEEFVEERAEVYAKT